jgi:hypothetical protein
MQSGSGFLSVSFLMSLWCASPWTIWHSASARPDFICPIGLLSHKMHIFCVSGRAPSDEAQYPCFACWPMQGENGGSHSHSRSRSMRLSLQRAASRRYDMTGETGSYRYMAPEVFRHEPYNSKVVRHVCLACMV